jgi:predicted transcriptional regulator
MSKMKRMLVRVEPELFDRLTRLSQHGPATRPQIIRYALKTYLAGEEARLGLDAAPLRRAADARERSGSEGHESTR